MSAIEHALQRVLLRVDQIEKQAGDRFPLYRHSASPLWTTTARGSWAGGFWAGLLWLRATISGRADHRLAAADCTRRLLSRTADDTVTRAMTFGYGAAIPHLLTGDASAAIVARTGAAALAESFDPRWGLIPAGTAFSKDSHPSASVDALAAVVALLSWSGYSALADLHTTRMAALCVIPGGRVRAEVPLTASTPEPAPWTRGQAWAMLGFAVASDRLGSPHIDPAVITAEWWLAHETNPADTSAAAIAAAALLTLPDNKFHEAGLSIVDTLAKQIDSDGILGGAQYAGLDDAEVIWGTYFAAALLSALTGRVNVTPW